MTPKLTPTALLAIELIISRVFKKAKARFLGTPVQDSSKSLSFDYKPELSIKGIFNYAAMTEGAKPNVELLGSISKISTSYFDAAEAKAKAKIINKLQSILTEGFNNPEHPNIASVMAKETSDLWDEITNDVKRIASTETNSAKNISTMDAITKVNMLAGINDPIVAFICVHDDSLCPECKKLHLMPNEVTPRAWKLSELGAGYHKKGDKTPKISGLHPNERCQLVTIMPGYGFDSSGRITYKYPGWNELNHQRGE